jgi:hypothetical protein
MPAGPTPSLAALPYLQRAALTPHLRDLARTHEVGLKQLRAAAAAATGTAEPEIAPLRRVRAKDVLTMAALIVAAYILITRLAEIGFDTIGTELRARRARMGGRRAAHRPVRIRRARGSPCGEPSGLAAPTPPLCRAAVGDQVHQPDRAELCRSIGMNLRFLQQMGTPRAQALASGAVDDVSRTMVQAALLLISIPLVGASCRHEPIPWARQPSARGHRCRGRRQRGRLSWLCRSCATWSCRSEERAVRRLERRPGSAQANRALRLETCSRS